MPATTTRYFLHCAKTAYAVAWFVLLLAATGCGHSDADADAAGSWTIERDRVHLEEDLLVTDNDDFYFGYISDLALDAEGHVYVADGRAHHVKVLSPEGDLLETVGREGEGPGEFQDIEGLVVGPGDSLYVYSGGERVSVFAPMPAYALVRTVAVDRADGPPPRDMMVRPQGNFYFLYERVRSPGDDTDEPLIAAVRSVDHRGTPRDTLAILPAQEMIVEQTATFVAYVGVPFGRKPRVAYGPEGWLHAGWTDSLIVRTYAASGERLREVRLPFDPVSVTQSDHERFLADLPEQLRDVVRGRFHETKPAFEELLVDDQGRYWFERATADHEVSDWWIADPAVAHVDVVALPSVVDLMVVRNGYAYGRTETDTGAPALVRYQVESQ